MTVDDIDGLRLRLLFMRGDLVERDTSESSDLVAGFADV
jgi:hypothetical protein